MHSASFGFVDALRAQGLQKLLALVLREGGFSAGFNFGIGLS